MFMRLEDTTNQPHYLVVGGGPIGLLQALCVKKLNGNAKVTVLEKYEQYQRKHTLIMQPAALEAVMKSTHCQNDPILTNLLRRLKKDPHIRTNELETILKDLGKKHGVNIINTEVQETKDETVIDQLSKFKPDFIIGADGTHSIINKTFFTEKNHVKIEFDYVLQYRFEVKGEYRAEGIGALQFVQHMARQGIVANEYVGHYDQKSNSTPMTMQMMISKDEFLKLQSATSKNPIYAFNTDAKDVSDESKSANQLKFQNIPTHIQAFLNEYIRNRIKISNVTNCIDPESVRISVNEAPATYAKQPVKIIELAEKNIPVVLSGDSSLGLSYFKGLNAGFLSSAKLFDILGSLIKRNEINDLAKVQAAFKQYQHWFVNDFAPKKVREVESYSTWNIRSAMKFMKVTRYIKGLSAEEDFDDNDAVFRHYFNLLENNPNKLEELNIFQKGIYPHRDHDLIRFAQFGYIPITYTLMKMGKIVSDTIKPYKSTFQFKQDLKQPLVGTANTLVGCGKIVVGLFSLNVRTFGDGLFNVVRGAVEIVTSPLALTLKPLVRGIITLFSDEPVIEKNSGIQRVAMQGIQELAKTHDDKPTDTTLFKLLAVAHDLHRKFTKSRVRGQGSKIHAEEASFYSNIRAQGDEVSKESLLKYYSLFYKTNLVIQQSKPDCGVIKKYN